MPIQNLANVVVQVNQWTYHHFEHHFFVEHNTFVHKESYHVYYTLPPYHRIWYKSKACIIASMPLHPCNRCELCTQEASIWHGLPFIPIPIVCTFCCIYVRKCPHCKSHCINRDMPHRNHHHHRLNHTSQIPDSCKMCMRLIERLRLCFLMVVWVIRSCLSMPPFRWNVMSFHTYYAMLWNKHRPHIVVMRYDCEPR